MKKIGIIGSAVVGQTLARGFKQHGYEVRIGSRTPEKLAQFAADAGIAARAIEPLAQLWCIPGFRQNQWTHAFKVLWK